MCIAFGNILWVATGSTVHLFDEFAVGDIGGVGICNKETEAELIGKVLNDLAKHITSEVFIAWTAVRGGVCRVVGGVGVSHGPNRTTPLFIIVLT